MVRIVYEDIGAPELPPGGIGKTAACRNIGNVGGYGNDAPSASAQFRCDAFQTRRGASRQDKIRAFPRKSFGNGAPETRPDSRNDGDSIFQLHDRPRH